MIQLPIMPYLIDGHNLIPKVPGLSLRAIDDEMQLVLLLQEFCRRQRKKVEVYFDNGPPGQPRLRKYGTVAVRFTRAGTTADEAIARRLQRLGGAARNWTVVSSDLQVQSFARQARARVLSSEAFARLLSDALDEEPGEAEEGVEPKLSAEEIQRWLKIFGEDEGPENN